MTDYENKQERLEGFQTPVTDEQMAAVMATAPIKRKRGRPRKTPNQTPVSAQTPFAGAPLASGEGSGEGSTPKKRGRKPKDGIKSEGRRKKAMKVVYDGRVDLPAETPNFSAVHSEIVKHNIISKAGIRVPDESSIFLWTYKDKFVLGISTMITTEKEGRANFHYQYGWHIIDRNTWKIVESYEGKKENIFEKVAKYDGKNIVCAKHIQMLVEEIY